MKHCSINYQIKLEEEASVSINERGFLFGDGIFETLRFENQKIYNFLDHKKRLNNGLESIKISFDLTYLEKNILELIFKNNINNGLVRVYISRGNGSLGYSPKKNIKPLITIQIKELPKKPKQEITLGISKISKISKNSLPINYKLAQGLNSTLVKIEATEKNYFDNIMLNDLGEICETSSANIFWVKNNILFTPNIDCGVLIGTIRNKIINSKIIKISEVSAKIEDLIKSDEIYLTNVSYKILKVDKIDFGKNNIKKYQSSKYYEILENSLKSSTQ